MTVKRVAAVLLLSGLAILAGQVREGIAHSVPNGTHVKAPATGEESANHQIDQLITREGLDWRRGR